MPNAAGQESRSSGIEPWEAEPWEALTGRSRLVWGTVLGVLMVVAGLAVLHYAIVASAVSVVFLASFAVLGGIAGVLASLFHFQRPGFWPTLLGGTFAFAVGIALLRRPGLSAAALTLLLGMVLLFVGVARVVGGISDISQRRSWTVGVVTLLLGLLILFWWPGPTLWTPGTFLGIALIAEGVSAIMWSCLGMLRRVKDPSPLPLVPEAAREEAAKVWLEEAKNEEARFNNLNARAVGVLTVSGLVTSVAALFAGDVRSIPTRPIRTVAGFSLALAVSLLAVAAVMVVAGVLWPRRRPVFGENDLTNGKAASRKDVHRVVVEDYSCIARSLETRNSNKAFWLESGYAVVASAVVTISLAGILFAIDALPR